MTEPVHTRCPGCATVFRVTAEQLALREGQVRCGQCRAVFDANDHLVGRGAVATAVESGPQRPVFPAGQAGQVTPASTGPATLREGPAEAPSQTAKPKEPPGEDAAEAGAAFRAEPPAEDAIEGAPTPGAEPPAGDAAKLLATPRGEPRAEDATESAASAGASSALSAEGPGAPALADRPIRYEWRPRTPLREQPKALYAWAIVILVLALALQAVYGYRDLLAAHAPFTRPLLQSACDVLGCAIEPLRDSAALSIEASDLHADPAHRGLLVLTATIRNRAAYAIAYPHLELTLTDASDGVVARRSLAPADYVGGTASVGAGIPGNGEKIVKLFLDASATSQAGYRLYLFYP